MLRIVRVLVIYDDDPGSGRMIEQLSEAGFDVDAANVFEDGIRRAVSGLYALLVLDARVTAAAGFEIVRRIRAASSLPIILLTGGAEDVDRIVGLEVGADDCLSRPYNAHELTARIRALLRRSESQLRACEQREESAIRVGDLQVFPASRTALCGGQALDLTGAEFELLLALLRSAGKVVSREDLARTAFGRRIQPADRTIDVHISRLRRKLAQCSEGVERIKTLHGSGYLCITGDEGDVSCAEEDSAKR